MGTKSSKKKRKSKYDITVKTTLSPDELLKVLINTKPKKKK